MINHFPISRFLDALGFKYILGKNIFVSLKKSQNKLDLIFPIAFFPFATIKSSLIAYV